MIRAFYVLLLVVGISSHGCGGDSSDNGGTRTGMDASGSTDAGIDGGQNDSEPDVFSGAPQCSDNTDNDGDGLIDLADPGCDDALDNDEQQRQCADGEDNDGDGLTDYPADPGCGSAGDNDELNPPQPPQCADGVDNDRNGLVDEQDPGCASAADTSERAGEEAAQCSDLIDNDGDGVIDFPDELGCSAAGDNDESDPRTTPLCANEFDDDMDGLVDYPADPGCFGRGDRDETDKPVTPACADSVDNDRDGQTDFPDDEGCTSASDSNEKGACLDDYDPPTLTADSAIVIDSSRGVFESEGTCGGRGSPETVVRYVLDSEVDALVFSTRNEGTQAASTLYIRYQQCLNSATEIACNAEVPNTPAPGQRLRIEKPVVGEYFIFVDGVAGAGGQVELSVTEVPRAACLNEIDDDMDGLLDYPEDPGCLLPSDRDESDPASAPVCANQIDDDGDGQIDFPNDVGCFAAAWDSEADLCGSGVVVREYYPDAAFIIGDTSADDASNVLDPNSLNCGRTSKPENVFVYRNRYRARLTISTDYPETRTNTAVYLRSTCTSGRSELACGDGAADGSNHGSAVVEAVEPGLYFIVVDTSIGLPGPFKLTVRSEYDELQCSDHIDNDGDGRIDDDDPGCSGQDDRSERQSSGIPECNNSEDDDRDGRIDWPLDPGCEARGDDSEQDPVPLPECADGIDNDGDGLIDIPMDPGCTSRGDPSEEDLRISPACSNGRDDDGDGLTDFGEDPDCMFAGDRDEG
ncbi:MAG: hypothetical protein VYA30_04645 [Myxococcota bacterium]|nr:hypothetical protein [Myxococcota bacterium]